MTEQGRRRRGGRRRRVRRAVAVAVAGLLTACGPPGRAAVAPGTPVTAGTLPPTAPPATSPPTTAETTVPTTPAPTRTLPPPDPQLLAGGMVLCSFSGATVPDWALGQLRAGLAAGLLLYQRNLASEAQAAANAQAAQAAALASPVLVDGLLRGQLGFPGIVISDALDASGVGVVGTPGEAAVAGAVAGVDLFIAQGPGVCVDLQQALVAAMADGRLPVARAQQAADRVAQLRRTLASAPAG